LNNRLLRAVMADGVSQVVSYENDAANAPVFQFPEAQA
jgi:hypothetical protein